jgi:hypothetical protein
VARSQCQPKSHIPRSLRSYVARLEFTYVTNLSMPVHLECQKDLSKLSVPLKYTTEYKSQAAKTCRYYVDGIDGRKLVWLPNSNMKDAKHDDSGYSNRVGDMCTRGLTEV